MRILKKIKSLLGTKNVNTETSKKDATLLRAESQTALEEIELRDR